MKQVFIPLFSSISLFASESISEHMEELYLHHLSELLVLVLITLLVVFLFVRYIISRINRQLDAKVAEEIYDLKKTIYDFEKAQAIVKTGSWVFDLKNNKLRWSTEIYSMFEIDKNDSDNLYEKFINRVHPDDRKTLEETYRLSLKNQTGYSLEHRLLMADGSIKYVLENCVNSFEEDGTPIISHGTVQDITEAALLQSERKEKDAYMFQQSRLAFMGEMLSMIAHQWRQPLGAIAASNISIQTTLELDKYNLKDEKQKELFFNFLNDKLNKNTQYVQTLSETITNFSNFYKPDRELELKSVDDVILKAYDLLGDSFKSYNIKVEFNLKSNSELLMHKNEFMQVILNIMNNAKDQLLIKGSENPMIEVSSYVHNGKLYIKISDNAGGIDEDRLNKIFDPYYSTKSEKNERGLGLYMSKIIIKDYHDGDIYAKNSDNGAIFTIRIKV